MNDDQPVPTWFYEFADAVAGQKRDVPAIGTATPEELATMTEAFDSHCLLHNIGDESARSNVAHLVMLLFEGGLRTVEAIRAGLVRLHAE